MYFTYLRLFCFQFLRDCDLLPPLYKTTNATNSRIMALTGNLYEGTCVEDDGIIVVTVWRGEPVEGVLLINRSYDSPTS